MKYSIRKYSFSYPVR
ncbi:hypothetical protein ABDK00_002750 [Niabella insulamsoli]